MLSLSFIRDTIVLTYFLINYFYLTFIFHLLSFQLPFTDQNVSLTIINGKNIVLTFFFGLTMLIFGLASSKHCFSILLDLYRSKY